MSTTTFGYNYARNNYFFSDGALDNQAWDTAVVVGDVGRIQSLSCYIAGHTATCTGGPVLWSSGGVVLIDGSNHSVAQGTLDPNGGFTINHTGLDYTFANPTTFFVGAFRNSADSWIVPFADNQGAYGVLKTVGGASPTALSGGSTWISQSGFVGGVTAFATYFIGTTYVRRAAAWVKVQWPLRRSSAWPAPSAEPQISVRRGSGWTLTDTLANDQELDWKVEEEAMVTYPDGSWEEAIIRWDYDQPHRTSRELVTV